MRGSGATTPDEPRFSRDIRRLLLAAADAEERAALHPRRAGLERALAAELRREALVKIQESLSHNTPDRV